MNLLVCCTIDCDWVPDGKVPCGVGLASSRRRSVEPAKPRKSSQRYIMGASISFAGKHVVITGGSEGIGLALAQLFLQDGATVSLVSRSEGKLRKAASKLKVRRASEHDL